MPFNKESLAATSIASNRLFDELPTELLVDIFSLASGTIRKLYYPPNLDSDMPWVLGRVCSRWRQISRSEPCLWGKFVCVRQESSLTGKVTPRFGLTPTILPEHVFFRFIFITRGNTLTDGVRLAITALCEHRFLRRIQSLDLHITIETYNEMWRLVRPEDFELLQTLKLFVQDREEYREPQLVIDEAFEVHQWWKDSSPFCSAFNLRKLKIGASASWIATYLSAQFPWNQITILRCHHIQGDTAEKLDLLQKCSSLQAIEMSFDRDATTTEITGDFKLSQHLRYFVIHDSFPLALVHALTTSRVWDHILTLALYNCDLPDNHDLYTILKKCPLLTNLYLHQDASPPTQNIYDQLFLPRLSRIHTSDNVASWLFARLLVPALEHLCIYDGTRCFTAARDMVVTSRCVITSFILSSLGEGHVDGMLELLEATPGLTSLHITAILPLKVVDGITCGTALPHLTSLVCFMDLPRQVKDMVKGRLEWEVTTRGRVDLRDICAVVRPAEQPDWDTVMAELNRLEETYDGVSLRMSFT
ncbi:hypothetical protein DXG03_009088 [Asterophora parasitica]|uniref:F-box domain-containing protein n=1 Tax=Asterophora parasitica TaxID=117018 RepID=A0A9P7KA30_9AGAR|nr:hypothetical protein DXG03_009088 [Asterophora parasitica]